MKFNPQRTTRTGVWSEVDGPLAKPYDFVEVTNWHNGEGFDVHIGDNKHMSMTLDEWTTLRKLVNTLTQI